MWKICNRCKTELHIDEFHKGTGCLKRDNTCKKCRLKYNNERYRLKKLLNPPSSIEKVKACQTRSMHKRRSKTVKHTLTAQEWRLILYNQKNKCNHCGISFDIVPPQHDCIIPLSKGGALTYENTQALCRTCNSKKHTKLPPGIKLNEALRI